MQKLAPEYPDLVFMRMDVIIKLYSLQINNLEMLYFHQEYKNNKIFMEFIKDMMLNLQHQHHIHNNQFDNLYKM